MNARRSMDSGCAQSHADSGRRHALVPREATSRLLSGLAALSGLASADITLVVGNACIGKSSVGEALRRAAAESDVWFYAPAVVSGWGASSSLQDGFCTLEEAVRLAQVSCQLSRLAPSDSEARRDEQVDVAPAARLLCFIDDADRLHELDLHRLLALVRVARDAGAVLSVVATARSVPPALLRADDIRMVAHPIVDLVDSVEPLDIRIVELQPLNLAETGVLLRLHLGREPSSSLVAQAHIATGGNPLLVCDIASELQKAGTLALPSGFIVASSHAQRLETSAAKRVRKTTSEATTTLHAFLLGPGAQLPVVVAATGFEEAVVLTHISQLEELGLLRFDQESRTCEPGDSTVYSYVAAVLPRAERERLHRRIGETWLTGIHSSHADAKPIAAWHFSRAGLSNEAAECASSALPGLVAQRKHVMADAMMDIIERALHMDSSRGVAVAVSLAEAADTAWSMGRASTTLRLSSIGLEALAAAENPPSEIELELMWNQSRAQALCGDADAAEQILRNAEQSPVAQSSSEWQARLLTGWCIVHQMRGEFDEIQSAALRAIEHLGDRKNHRLSGVCYNAIGNALLALCKWSESRGWHVKAENAARSVGDSHAELISQFNIALADYSLGSWELAEEELISVVARGAQLHHSYALELAENLMGLLQLRRGDLNGSRRSLRLGMAWSRECGDEWGLALSYSNRGVLEHELGRPRAAHRLFQRARQLMDGAGSRDDVPELLRRQAQALIDLGHTVDARRVAQEGLRLAIGFRNTLEECNCRRVLSEIALSLDAPERSRELADHAATSLRALGAGFEEAMALRQLAEAEKALGRQAEARDAAAEALSILTRLSSRREIRRTREVLARIDAASSDARPVLAMEPNRLASLCRSSRAVACAESVDQLAREAADIAASEIPADVVSVVVRLGAGTSSVVSELCDVPDAEGVTESVRRVCSGLGEGLVEAVLIEATGATGPMPELVRELGVRRALVVPMRGRDATVGHIYLDYRTRDAHFTDDDIRFVEALAIQAATALENIELRAKLEAEIETLRWEVDGRYSFSNIIGRSVEMQKVFSLLERVSPSSATVLVEGESGTGKELVARAIHHNSPRKNERFVPQNCAALPEQLLESELFGHVRGAFTGALKEKRGLFEAADGGTFFLDEIADMPPSLQVKLLRVLQDGEVRRVGATDSIRVDVRIIAATNKSLEAEVKAGRFRHDLYYRLNVVRVEMPPLRIRRDDIPLLAQHFLDTCATESDKDIRGFTDGAMGRLVNYDWPGNVRELENEMQRAVALARNEVNISEKDLSERIRSCDVTVRPSRHGASLDLKDMVEDIERRVILQMLEEYNWNKSKTAEALGLSRQGLLKKIARLKLRRDAE